MESKHVFQPPKNEQTKKTKQAIPDIPLKYVPLKSNKKYSHNYVPLKAKANNHAAGTPNAKTPTPNAVRRTPEAVVNVARGGGGG